MINIIIETLDETGEWDRPKCRVTVSSSRFPTETFEISYGLPYDLWHSIADAIIDRPHLSRPGFVTLQTLQQRI